MRSFENSLMLGACLREALNLKKKKGEMGKRRKEAIFL